MSAYYNEIDPHAAQWLRNLIAAGHIAPGDVDERSILEVSPDDLRGYTQCHFFAGIGVWSYALRRAGWADDRPVWTGSCPCQPFSSAGKGLGHEDERHLWPAWQRLIAVARPHVVFGEQVANGDGYAWIDVVGNDLEGLDYALGALCPAACGVGAPHIRQRLYFVADATSEQWSPGGLSAAGLEPGALERPARLCSVGELAHPGAAGFGVERRGGGDCSRHARGNLDDSGTPGGGLLGHSDGEQYEGAAEGAEQAGRGVPGESGQPVVLGNSERCRGRQVIEERQSEERAAVWGAGEGGGLADTAGDSASEGRLQRVEQLGLHAQGGNDDGAAGEHQRPVGPVNGFWAGADWVWCRDPDGPRWRPIEPGTFPLAHGVASRVVKLRAYGNAINAEVAVEFISAYRDARGC